MEGEPEPFIENLVEAGIDSLIQQISSASIAHIKEPFEAQIGKFPFLDTTLVVFYSVTVPEALRRQGVLTRLVAALEAYVLREGIVLVCGPFVSDVDLPAWLERRGHNGFLVFCAYNSGSKGWPTYPGWMEPGWMDFCLKLSEAIQTNTLLLNW